MRYAKKARTGWCAPFASYSISLQPAADVLHIALHALNEQRGVEAVGHGIEAPAEAVDHAVGRADEEHAVLSGCTAGGDDARDGRLKLGRVELSRHAHRDRQIERSDEDAVHAVHGADVLDDGERFGGLALREEQCLAVEVAHGLRHGTEPVKAPAVLARRAEAPLTDGVIFRVVHELLHLRERLDVRHDQALNTDVEQLEHGGAADLAHARERADAAQLGGTHERGGGLGLDGGVLVVDDGKVEPRAAEALHKAHAGGVKKGADRPRPAASFCLSVFSMRIPPYLVSMARLYLHFGTKASIDARTFASAESIAGQNENGGRSAFAVHVILVVIRHTFHVLCCQSYIAICRDPTVEFRFFLPAALRLQ